MPTTGSHLEDYLTTTLNANREPLEACVHVDDERLGNGGYPQLASEDAIASLWGAACAADASVGAPPLSEVSLLRPSLSDGPRSSPLR